MPARYMSSADVARLLGVPDTLVILWARRYPDAPQPDVIIGTDREFRGWHPSRAPEWTAWRLAHDTRTGRIP